MAINKNHLFDELNGIKCAIVESDVSPERVNFVKSVLEFNNYTVVVAPMPPPKVVPPKPAAPVAVPVDVNSATAVADVTSISSAPAVSPEAAPPPPPPPPEKFIIGVTHVSFNVTNAIFGRLLRTPEGHIVTMNYWLQKEDVSRDDVPYFEKG